MHSCMPMHVGCKRPPAAASRQPRGPAGDVEDLARLVRSAARPGLRERIAAYRASQRKN